MKKNIKTFVPNFFLWKATSLFLIAILLLPMLSLFTSIFQENTEVWEHILSTVFKDYVSNTVILLFGVGLISFILGTTCAWLVSAYKFTGSRFFEWALILPLAIPVYILAYTYAGIFDFTGPILTYSREVFGLTQGFTDIMSIKSILIILAFGLYPYVFILTKSSFKNQSANAIEASKLLGKSSLQTFYKVAIPMSRPAIVSGIILIFMEILADYGAMKYYGINTFTTAICQVWFSFNDLNAAIKLSLSLMFILLLIILIERILRGRTKYTNQNNSSKLLNPIKLSGIYSFLAFIYCGIVFVIGFGIPLIQLVIWTIKTSEKMWNYKLLKMITNSFMLAIAAAVLTVIVGFILSYTTNISKSKIFNYLNKIVSMGYSLPGAIIAIGVLIPFLFIYNFIVNNSQAVDNTNLLMSGYLIILVLGFVIRFVALAIYPIDSEFEKIGKSLQEASWSLGSSNLKTLFRINIPLLKGATLVAAILVFVNVIKELPLTIILRPFNFDTLAIKSFEMAKDEMIPESASLAIVIILVNLVPVFFLNKLTNVKSK